MLDRWKGETVCILASGESLTQEDADYARSNCSRIIVINRTWKRCPTADVLYAADRRWWLDSNETPRPDEFAGERWTTSRGWDTREHRAALQAYNHVETNVNGGFSLTPPINTGRNSSFQALGLAAWWGSRRVVFLGLDMTGGTWHGDTPNCRHSNPNALNNFAAAFTHAAPMIAAAGVEVINASRRTALTCFPQMSIEDALKCSA